MSELKKVINNQMDNIDFGKLIEEAKECLQGYDKFIHKIDKEHFDKLNTYATLLPAINTLYVVNAVLNHIGLLEDFIPLIAAGLSVLEKSIMANVGQDGRECYEDTKRILEKNVTSITFEKPQD